MSKTPSKYDSIIITEYKRYEADCGLKIGDHKILCKVFDAQDSETQRMINEAYDRHAVLITDEVRKMLFEFKTEVFARFDKIELRIDGIQTQLNNLTATVDCTRSEIDLLKAELKKLKVVNSWWHITGRWISGVIAAIAITYYLYREFWSKLN